GSLTRRKTAASISKLSSLSTPSPPRKREPRGPGCGPAALDSRNSIGFNKHGHDSAITFSRHPGAGRDPCFHKHLSLIASATVSHRTAPRRLHYGSRPAPGWRNLYRRGDEGQLDHSLEGRDPFRPWVPASVLCQGQASPV